MVEFDEIYVEYFSDVYKYVLSLCRDEDVAEDVTQETFFKALKSIDSFNETCKMRVWLCQIAKNTYFTYYMKEKRIVAFSDVQGSADAESIEQKLLNDEAAFEIHKAIHRMGEPYKEVISLRLFGELSFAKIAELFGKTESWARVTFHRAKAKLQEELS